MIKNKEALADRLKGIKINGEDITLEKLVASFTDDKAEVEVQAEPFHLLNEAQLSELKTTLKKDGYEEGKLAGGEMFARKLKQSFGLNGDDYPGKDLDSVTKILKDKVLADAKIEPEKKVKELSDSLQSLQQTLQSKESEFNSLLTQKDQTIKTIKTEAYLLTAFPKVDGYKPNHILAAFKSDGYGVDFDDNNQPIPVHNGKVLKDQYEKPVELNKVVTEWLTSSGFQQQQTPGRGAGNNYSATGSQFKTENDLFKHMEQNKIDPTSPQGKEMIDKFYGQK